MINMKPVTVEAKTASIMLLGAITDALAVSSDKVAPLSYPESPYRDIRTPIRQI
jgi:hypothetical protein